MFQFKDTNQKSLLLIDCEKNKTKFIEDLLTFIINRNIFVSPALMKILTNENLHFDINTKKFKTVDTYLDNLRC